MTDTIDTTSRDLVKNCWTKQSKQSTKALPSKTAMSGSQWLKQGEANEQRRRAMQQIFSSPVHSNSKESSPQRWDLVEVNYKDFEVGKRIGHATKHAKSHSKFLNSKMRALKGFDCGGGKNALRDKPLQRSSPVDDRDVVNHAPRYWGKRFDEEAREYNSLVLLSETRLNELMAQMKCQHKAKRSQSSQHYDSSGYRIAYSADILCKFFDALMVPKSNLYHLQISDHSNTFVTGTQNKPVFEILLTEAKRRDPARYLS